MPTLSVTNVTQIATAAARAESSKLQVIGVTVSGEGNYAEVIIDIDGCRDEPCRFSLGVFRDASAEVLREEIAGQLRQHVRGHIE